MTNPLTFRLFRNLKKSFTARTLIDPILYSELTQERTDAIQSQ